MAAGGQLIFFSHVSAGNPQQHQMLVKVSNHSLLGFTTLMALSCVDAFAPSNRDIVSISRPLLLAPKGCAAKPFDKKKIAVFGAGGYLGAVVFGFLQRAASLYGTGIAGGPSPRAICATGSGSDALNRVLGPSFKLAYAGEDLVRLVDTSEADHIKERLKNYDAAIIGTTYQLERRSVTLNTYEKTPNDKTFEFYLDERYGARENDVPSDDSDIHASIFGNTVRACKEAGICHLVVFETPKTVQQRDFLKVLDEVGIPYTYIRTDSALKKDITYTFEKGISNKLGVVRLSPGSKLADTDTLETENRLPVSREDIAAFIVQSLMTLDWGQSRILEINSCVSNISSGYGEKESRGQRYDKEWCPNSKIFADVLSAL